MNPMPVGGALALAWTAAAVLSAILDARAAPSQPSGAELRPVSAFDDIRDRKSRSVALFEEAGKVIQHPRCLNCHPKTDRPLQGDDMHAHVPPVRRGDGGMGTPAMRCTTCHTAANYDPAQVPGHPRWLLAPAEMAWVGQSLGQICRQLKDPARNGGKDMKALVDHMAHDSLVGWGWQPGAGRTPVPGTQAAFGRLIQAWVDTGAHCPG
jgi:hypothetical protein